MSVVTFDEPQIVSRSRVRPGFSGWLVRKQIVATHSQASMLLLVVTIIFLVVALLVFRKTLATEPVEPSKHFVPAYNAQH